MRLGFCAAATAALGIACATAHAERRTFFVDMDGSQEVGPAGGDVDGFALGTITLDDASGEISWSFRYGDIAAPTAMHIHGPNAPVGTNAGVFIGLGVTTTGGSGTLINSFIHGNLAEITQILANPSGFYVNIHNADFSPGAVRGNLSEIQKDVTIELQEVATGLTAPVSLTHAGDGSGRLFVVDQPGTIRIIDAQGNLLATPFLDLAGEVVTVNPGFDERGALGVAFHPDYETNGRFFVRYSKPRTGTMDEPCFGSSRGCHEEVLAEFTVSADPNVANPTGTILFRVDEPQFNHNSGGVAFGPDGFLYFTLGDGGGAHDGLADMPPSHGPEGNGQNIETALGSILRIDVSSAAPGSYAVPPDNPFVGVTGVDEIYAYGMRNPYRFSFDDGPGGDGRLIVADVGQALFEEINVVVNGGNYGWVIREGFRCFDPFAPSVPPLSCATTGALGEPLLDPIAAYHHGDGLAVVGGFVYRGSRFGELVGKYVFGDWSTGFGASDGRLFWLDADGADQSTISEFRLGAADAPLGRYLFGLGEDEEGEIYALTTMSGGPTGATGVVSRIIHPCPCEADGDPAQVDVFDLLAFLNDWFAGSFYAERDGSPGVDVFDLLAFLDCWFPASAGTACP